MVSNEIYEELKRRKGSRSFSELIRDSLQNKKKTGEGLRKFYGILEGDTEYINIQKDSRRKWKEWETKTRREYA